MRTYNKYQAPENNTNKIILMFCFLSIVFLFSALFVLFNHTDKSAELDTSPLENVTMKPFDDPDQGYLPENDAVTIKRTCRGERVDIIPQAKYKIYGRIFTKHHVPAHVEYGELMPYDMVIAWGKMAKPEMFNMVKFEYEFYDRYVWWTFSRKIQDDPDELSTYFSNNHIIPANTDIRKGLDSIKVKDIAYMEGFLVNLVIYKKDGMPVHMDTSLWRDDDGEGACEVFYVTHLVTRNGDFR